MKRVTTGFDLTVLLISDRKLVCIFALVVIHYSLKLSCYGAAALGAIP